MNCTRKGSALLIMLWAIGLLSASVLALATFLLANLDEDADRAKLFRARQLAESGVVLALHPLVKKSDPLLRSQITPMEGFAVVLRSEGARFNPNAIANQEDADFFRDIFTSWGATREEADALADAIMDWVDGDDLKRLQGAENADYTSIGKPQLPRNRPMESVSEMSEIKGMDLLDRLKPGWQEYFTVWSQGKIDVNEASQEILEIVTGAAPAVVESFVRARAGLDGIPDTEDDFQYEDLDQVRAALAMSQAEFDRIADRLSLRDNLVRIESTGIVGDFRTRMSAVARRSEGSPEILTWIEP